MTASNDGPDVLVAATAESAATAAAELIAGMLTSAVAQRGAATIALSGGNSPIPMLQRLADSPVDWLNIDVFQVDERVVGPTDPDRNWAMIERSLLEPAGVPTSRRHPMPVGSSDVDGGAGEYASRLRTHAPHGLDVVHLGLGSDGHTASWPPGDAVVDAPEDVVVIGEFNGHRRMTLTPRVVNSARNVVWLVTGTDKATTLRCVLAADPTLPASRVRLEPGVVIVTDSESAP